MLIDLKLNVAQYHMAPFSLGYWLLLFLLKFILIWHLVCFYHKSVNISLIYVHYYYYQYVQLSVTILIYDVI